MLDVIKKIVGRRRKLQFLKMFYSFDITSGIGSNGVGRGCIINGPEYISIGKECFFGENTVLSALGNHFEQKLYPQLIIGNHVRCIGGCRITCADCIIIENDVLIGPQVFITDHNHGMNPELQGGYSEQPLLTNKVLIKEGVWLGEHVSVLPGVTIGEHSIVGTNSVVTHDIPAYSVAVGSPAKVIKMWDKDDKIWISKS